MAAAPPAVLGAPARELNGCVDPDEELNAGCEDRVPEPMRLGMEPELQGGPDAASPVDAALEAAGFGRFQFAVMAMCGMAWFVDSVEAGGLAYIYVTLDAEWGTTTADWGLLQSTKSMCSVVGALVFGTGADRCGRRPAFLAALMLTAFGGLASAAARGFWSMLVLRSVTNMGAGGLLPVAISLLAEHLPPSRRDSCMVVMQIFFVLGHVLAVLLAMALGSETRWRVFLVALALPTILLACCFQAVPESPTYLYQTGQVANAEEALRRIQRVNRSGAQDVSLPPPLAPSAKAGATDATGLARLFSTWALAQRTASFGLLWFLAMAASDYTNWITELGHTLGVPRHQVEGFMIACKLVGVCAFLSAAVLARGGRGPVILRGAFVAAALASAAVAVVVTARASRIWLALSVGALYFPFDVVWSLLYATTASGFDSLCRASALSVASTCSRIALTVVPMLSGRSLVHHEFGTLCMWTSAWVAGTVVACSIRFSPLAPQGKGPSEPA